MPEELLNHSKVGAAIQQVSGKAMAQHMGVNPFIEPGLDRIPRDNLLKGALGESLTVSAVSYTHLTLPTRA